MTTPGKGRISTPAPRSSASGSNGSGASGSGSSGSGSKPKARCVLWCAPGSTPEPELLDALQRRREVETEVVHSGYEAFALLCQRATMAKATGDHAVLLLVDPAKLVGAVRVMESAAIYAAGSSTWAYDRSTTERLRGVNIDDIAALTGAASAPQAWPDKPAASHTEVKVAGVITGPRSSPISVNDPGIISSARVSMDPPQLRLTGSHASPAEPPATEQTSIQAPAPSSHLLTDEELAMLLSSEPDEDGRR